MIPFYQQPGFTLPAIGKRIKEHYQRESFKVQWAFSECAFSEWTAGRRDAEGYLHLSIDAIRANVAEEANTEYIRFLAEYVYLLIVWTANDHGYILPEPERCFVDFLANPIAYQAFSEKDIDGRGLAWLCVSASGLFPDGDTSPENSNIATLIQRLTGNTQTNREPVTMQSTVDALYGPACWELYHPGGYADIASILWDNGVTINHSSPTKHLIFSETILPNDQLGFD